MAYNMQHTGSQLDEAISKVESGYADVSSVDAAAGDVRQGKKIVNSSGQEITGTLVPGTSPTGTVNITTNGTHDVAAYASANVNVPSDTPETQEKMVTPTAESVVVIPDSGKLLSKVTVNGDADLISENIKQGVNVFGVTGSYTGGSPELQSKTAMPTESQQTVEPDSGYDGLSSVTVDAISSAYIGSGVPRKSAQTYTPGTSDQMISAGQYLAGAQTIKGDANLLPGNIKDGVSIFGVVGTHSGGTPVQTYSGTFTTDSNGIGTITCGFKPDFIVIDVGVFTSPQGVLLHAFQTFPVFMDGTHPVESIAWGNPVGLNMLYGEAYNPTNTGVTIAMYEIKANWSIVALRTVEPIVYTAYKFL